MNGMLMTLVILAVQVLIGVLLGRAIFGWKHRNRSVGAALGGVTGLFPLFLIIFVIVAALWPANENPKAALLYDGNNNLAIELERLKTLYQEQLIDADEFKALKAKILNPNNAPAA